MKISFMHPTALLTLLIIAAGCASTGVIGGSQKIYNEPYSKMAKIVEQTINRRSLSINNVNESPKGKRVAIKFSKPMKTNKSNASENSVEGKNAEVIVKKIDKKKTRITIINPDYHYSVPQNQRIEYDKSLIHDIDSKVNK